MEISIEPFHGKKERKKIYKAFPGTRLRFSQIMTKLYLSLCTTVLKILTNPDKKVELLELFVYFYQRNIKFLFINFAISIKSAILKYTITDVYHCT